MVRSGDGSPQSSENLSSDSLKSRSQNLRGFVLLDLLSLSCACVCGGGCRLSGGCGAELQGWVSVNDDLSRVCRQAQRVEQARQELISQVTESAAKTLETIRGLFLSLSLSLPPNASAVTFFLTMHIVFSAARMKRQGVVTHTSHRMCI